LCNETYDIDARLSCNINLIIHHHLTKETRTKRGAEILMTGRGSGGIIPRCETALHDLGREAPKFDVDTFDGTVRRIDDMTRRE
jgi:hypothetical protein